jgi:predicted SAM-dependent methyltransferase
MTIADPHVGNVFERVRLLGPLARAGGKGRNMVFKHARSLHRRTFDRRRIARYLETHTVRKLQLGTGPNPLEGWLNTDRWPDIYPERRGEIIFLDATKPLPIADASLDYVFSEHLIEHVSEVDARSMLEECFRVARPGGRIRIATPDLARILSLYDDRLDEIQQHYLEWVTTRFRADIHADNSRCYVINRMFNSYGHKFIYDFETLSAMLAQAGFVDIVRFEPGESVDPVLRGIETHGRALGDDDVNRFETMVIEAARPEGRTEAREPD